MSSLINEVGGLTQVSKVSFVSWAGWATARRSGLLPLTDHSGKIGEIVQTALDAVWLGQATPADVLSKANADVNALFK